MYDTVDELLREILAGEDVKLDFKEVRLDGNLVRFPGGEGRADQEMAKDLSAFANTDGGVIVFGVRDDGERIGMSVEAANALEQFAVNVARDHVEPPMLHLLGIERVLIPDTTGVPKLCLKANVRRAADGVHAPKGRRPYLRVSSHCAEMTLPQMASILERRDVLRPFEERPLMGATPADLDLASFRRFVAERRGEPPEATEGHETRLLLNLKMAHADEQGALHPTVLGALLFAKEIRRHIDGAFVRLVVYAGDEIDSDRQVDRKDFDGPVPAQIEATLDYLRNSPYVPTAATKTAEGRLDAPAYALKALHEAVVNACVHRDYSITGSNVRVLVFRNRIEVWSPGRLVNSLTIENLFAGALPRRRNEALVGVLSRLRIAGTGRHYMEGDGEGFLAMVRETKAVTGSPPEVSMVGDALCVKFFARGSSATPGKTVP